MISGRLRKTFQGAFVLASALCLAGATGNARNAMAAAPVANPERMSQIVIGVGKSMLVELPSSYADVMIADPKIADILPLNHHAIYIVGKTMGTTALTVYGTGKRVIYLSDVVVSADLEGLQARIHELLPDETRVSVSPANQSIILSGTVSSPSALHQIETLADSYNPGKVVDMMTVEGTQQVMLSVRFVEMERSTAKDLRLNTHLTPTNSNPAVTVTTGDTLVNAATAALSTFGSGSLMWRLAGGDLSVLFDALETKGLTKTLAEPTLVTMSGETANFLAGGEFPIPVAQQSAASGVASTITVEFKQFGVSLAFTPTILQDGLINMVVNPEVSSIDPTTSVSEGGITIPGIKVRRAHTTVELRDGESFTIAGLLSDDYQNNINQFPFLGDLPVIGTLFRSTGYKRDETELVILVTPHLVTPRKTFAATPADRFVPPSDFELFLFGAQRGKAEDLAPEDRALMSSDPKKGGVDGPYGHVLY